jgi:hypothetical protein
VLPSSRFLVDGGVVPDRIHFPMLPRWFIWRESLIVRGPRGGPSSSSCSC